MPTLMGTCPYGSSGKVRRKSYIMHGTSTSIATVKHGIKLDGESAFNKQLVKTKRIIITLIYVQQLMILLILKLTELLTIAIISRPKSAT